MAKNHGLIEQMKAAAKLKQQIKQITPEVYAGIALALHRKQKWGYKRINELFMESQKIWDECVELDINMIELCEQETGIEVQGQVE